MGALANRKNPRRWIERLAKNVMVAQYYSSSERGKAGMF